MRTSLPLHDTPNPSFSPLGGASYLASPFIFFEPGRLENSSRDLRMYSAISYYYVVRKRGRRGLLQAIRRSQAYISPSFIIMFLPAEGGGSGGGGCKPITRKTWQQNSLKQRRPTLIKKIFILFFSIIMF